MLPDSAAEVMRRAADACGIQTTDSADRSSTQNNKELLRQQLLCANKEASTSCVAERPKHTRSRQKNRWKLKFHHQALPQEYLDHYEQSLQKANAAKKIKQEKVKVEQDTNNTDERVNNCAQRLAPLHTEAHAAMTHKTHKMDDKKRRQGPAIAPNKILTYDDLPYMGEMTLNNSKPRRGRKPKKADICHLIYENYGTVVPGQPAAHNGDVKPPFGPHLTTERLNANASKTDLQNKIISSLLERKLSQECRRAPAHRRAPDEPLPPAPPTMPGHLHSDSEPLNLCIRDLHELKIQIRRKFGNIYSSMPDMDDDTEQPNAISVIQRNTSISTPSPPLPTASSSPDLCSSRPSVSPTLSEPASLCWPGLYMHPLALQTQLLYYQRLAAAGRLPTQPQEDDRPPSTSTSASGSDGPDGGSPPALDNKSKLVLKQISELLDPKVIKQVEAAKRSPEVVKRACPNTLRKVPLKRKRSAIFIPPMPAKSNSSTPTAEVSICKFKFTGGSKPSLQEKKMLSVDSGGNFRYYSGSNNKNGKSSAHAGDENVSAAVASSSGRADTHAALCHSAGKEDNKRKRKSRKSLQREKLEQTFKEKGFLIQTQQLQSAEGATYCKFRQLRKFTRYLFRSWKDYLPGELEERPAGTGESAPETPVAGQWG